MGMMVWTTMDPTCRQLAELVNNEKIGVWLSVQRSEVWDLDRKGLLIDSIINSILIPAVILERRKDGTYDIIDGQQRIMTIVSFINDGFLLPKLGTWTYKKYDTNEIIEFDPFMKRFTELPQELKDIIYNQQLHVNCAEDLSTEQRRELYRRYNNGMALSVKDRNIAYCEDLDHVIEIGQHDFFKKVLSKGALRNRKYISIVMKAWIMLYYDEEASFESKVFNKVIKNTVISEEQEKEIINILDRMSELYDFIISDKVSWKKYKAKFKNETHFVSMITIVKRSVDENISTEKLYDFFKYFYYPNDGASISDSYNNASISGVAKSINISRRNAALNEAWEDFINQ